MSKENVIIYPYSIESAPIVRHPYLLKDYNIIGVVSPPGWSLSDKDASEADMGLDIGITVSDNFEDMIQKCETVLISHFDNSLSLDNVFGKIYTAIDFKKNIICTLNLEHEKINELAQKCSQAGVYFKYITQDYLSHEISEYEKLKGIYDIETPIMLIIGMSDGISKFEIQLSVRECLQKKGYKISQIGSRHYCELMGFHSFPDFMFGNKVSDIDKVFLFNRYVRDIEIREQPDLIIIGIPGGIMPYNKVITGNFGITALEVVNAVNADVCICNVNYLNTYSTEYFNLLKTSIKYKLGLDVDCFNLSNVMLDKENYVKNGGFNRLYLKSNAIEGDIKRLSLPDTPMFNTYNNENVEFISDFLIGKLESYDDQTIA